MLDCIVPADLDNQRPVTTDAVLDCAVLVQMLYPGSYVAIRDYVTDVFVPYILSWFERNNRVDIVWDVYSEANLNSTKISSHWAAFLRVDLNKEEFFVELAKTLKNIMLPQGKQLFTTILGDCASTLSDADVGAVAPCIQEESELDIFYMWLLPPSLVIVE